MPIDVTYPGVYIEELPSSPKQIEGVPTSITAFLGRAFLGRFNRAERCSSFSDFERQFGDMHPQSDMSHSVKLFFENGGIECYAVRILDGDDDIAGPLSALDEVDFNLMVIPLDPVVSEAARKAMLIAAGEYCARKKAFLLIDAPETWQGNVDQDAIGSFCEGIVPESAAVFYPRVIVDEIDIDHVKTSRPIGAAGAIAGLAARADSERGVWIAPAGTEFELRGVTGLEQHFTDEEIIEMSGAAVNCLREVEDIGIVNWGARTLAGSGDSQSEFKYIPVRRLTLFLEGSIYRGTQWAVFEPNDEPLWTAIRSSVTEFLTGLWQRGAFVGNKQDEVFYVDCGRDTLTEDDIDNGILNFEVGFAPMFPGEFVSLNFQHKCQPNASEDVNMSK